MPKKTWNGKGLLSQGVEVRFASRVGQLRRVPKPHPWPSPAADLKKEQAEMDAREDAVDERSG